MPSLKEIKGRINSISSTLAITSAMKMVAAAKLQKAQMAIQNMLPYERRLHSMLIDLMGAMNISAAVRKMVPYVAQDQLNVDLTRVVIG